MNYERLGKIFEAKPRKGAKKLSKRELARRGAASEEFDIVLFDESHALKNLTSLRAKFSVKLYGSAKMIFWLSATAGQTPLELGYLAPILAKKTGDWALTTKDFEQWCVDNLPGVSRPPISSPNEISGRTGERRSSWDAGLRRPTYRLRSHPRHHTLGHQFDVEAEAGAFQWTPGKAPKGTINLLARAAWTAIEKIVRSLCRFWPVLIFGQFTVVGVRPVVRSASDL